MTDHLAATEALLRAQDRALFLADPIGSTFSVGGFFAARFPGYEPRAGQLDLARAFHDAASAGRVAIGEGPCGTGKSLAYLVPAIHYAITSGKKVVVATAGIALQEQLVTKDLPLLAEILPVSFSFASLKGRQNYLCAKRLSETRLSPDAQPDGIPVESVIDDGMAATLDDLFAHFGIDAKQPPPNPLAQIGEPRSASTRSASSARAAARPAPAPRPLKQTPAETAAALARAADRRELFEILTWAEGTETGDVSELSFVPSRVWRERFSISADDCDKSKCSFAKQCHYERALSRATGADIIVVNYHLLLAHLSVRRDTGRDLVLPGFGLLVCDEAHELADIARDFLGWDMGFGAFLRIANWARACSTMHPNLSDELTAAAEDLFYRAQQSATPQPDGTPQRALTAANPTANQQPGPLRARLRGDWLGEHASCADDVSSALERIKAVAALVADGRVEHLNRDGRGTIRDEADRAGTIIRSIGSLLARVADVAACADPTERVYSVESTNGRTRLRCQLIHPAPVIADQLWGDFNATARDSTSIASVLLTSATMTTAGNFDFICGELGAPADAITVDVASPFDFAAQSRLVLPRGIPSPNEAGFANAVGQVVSRVAFATGGRTMALFTSYRGLYAAAQELDRENRHRPPSERIRVIRQGDAPRMELLADFKRAHARGERAVLLGTDSFWTGVDLPGEVLTALVIDKLPFPSPAEPLVEAITESNPRGVFADYMVPRAAMMLRQGVGRLIRARTDRGFVVLCDARLTGKAYGRAFLASLPPMPLIRDFADVTDFLATFDATAATTATIIDATDATITDAATAIAATTKEPIPA